jgi:hypothetical protein
MTVARPSKAITSVARKLLTQLLDETLAASGTVSAAKFRADNYSAVATLDELEASGLLKNSDGSYVVSPLALPMIDGDAARGMLADIEKTYAVLREGYRQTLSDPVTVARLSDEANLPRERVAAVLPLMVELSLWWQGHSANFTKEDAFVAPSEGVLKYPKFRDAIEQVLEWRWNPPLPSGTTMPSLLLDAAEVQQAAAQRRAMTEGDAGRSLPEAWSAIRACLQEFSFYAIKEITGLAGLDVTTVAHLVQEQQGSRPGASKGQLMSAIDEQFGKMASRTRSRFLIIAVEEILRRRPAYGEKLSEYLNRVGWAFADRTLVPIEVLDPADLEETPEECRKDLLKAAQRFRDGDLTGAVSAACGAVDTATALIYQQAGLGNPTAASFQERCRCAARAKGVLTELDEQLHALGWSPGDVIPFRKNLEGALNQGAYVMQTLRSHMGDVHGSKPILRPLVFDCLRWAELIVASLVERPAR